MPARSPEITIEDARRRVLAQGFGRTSEGIGIEVEWIPIDVSHPDAPVSHDLVREAIEGIAVQGRVTFEPGGQLEVSTPVGDLPEMAASITSDHRALSAALAGRGIALSGTGIDPRPTARVIRTPRYDAMETWFDHFWPHGRTMMTRTASVQVNIDVPGDRTTWLALNALAVIAAASFANSPADGWASSRLRTWAQIDPSRTSPVSFEGEPADAWVDHAMGARVMLIGTKAGGIAPCLTPITFAQWLKDPGSMGYPTVDDLDLHLTTLFPPIRPRGWFELRVCDSLPQELYLVPAVLAWGALATEGTRSAMAAMFDELPPALIAAKRGLHDPSIHRCALSSFEIALSQLHGHRNEDAAAIAHRYMETAVKTGEGPQALVQNKVMQWT